MVVVIVLTLCVNTHAKVSSTKLHCWLKAEVIPLWRWTWSGAAITAESKRMVVNMMSNRSLF